MMTESIEQFMEVARQLESDEGLNHSRDDREGSRESDRDDRERIRKGSSYERERKESSRYAPYPTSRSERDRAKKSESSRDSRVYVYNLSFTLKWQELKDHMRKVGDVAFAEIMEDSKGKSKGCGIVEFRNPDDARRAIRELNDTELAGRKLKIREDRVEGDDRPRRPRDRSISSSNTSSNAAANILGGLGGLGMMGLGQLGLLQQMSTRSDAASCSVFVSNLDYRVTWAKLKDTFKAAGKVIRADISEDGDGKSKGHGTVQFETPLEALNAVYTMTGKTLYERTMHVRLDRESPYFNIFGGNSSGVGAASGLGGMASVANMANMAGMASMNPLALLQLQTMANLGNMAGLNNLTGFGGMNYAGGTTGASTQSTGMATADASSLTNANNSSMTTALSNAMSNAMNSANPYAAMFGAQNLASQSLGGQTFGQNFLMPSTQNQAQLQVKVDTSKQVFVRNLPWKVTWQELKDKFREAGRVVRADVLMDDKQRSKGCGTVLYETVEEAARAITSLNGAIMDGRQIEVRMDRG